MKFEYRDGNFYLNNKKIFLNSGEIHYFRLNHNLWEKHLLMAKNAGLTTVSTYVPWVWHEYSEGKFDFDGTSCPERNLTGWLELCHQMGLTCILKPGPFILAELRGAGLPYWFLDKFGNEVKMKNSRGEKVASDGVSLFHDIYLKYVTHWYNQVMPFISKRQISAGGPVIMMQICNEIGVFSWLAHQADYNENIRNRFIAYLEKKYTEISWINKLWETNYQHFRQIELPPDGHKPYKSKGDRSRDYEWHCFWRTYYADYLKMLTQMSRNHGINIPLYHNLPGWIYGSGYEFPVNITMYDELFGSKSELIFGVDHIPEFVSYRNMHDDRIINDITKTVQKNKPLFAAEFQSGSREYHVVTNPHEMELFYKASIANGLTGWNYYMFSQGKNIRHTGYSGSTFYWFTPLNTEGEPSEAYSLIKRMSKIIATNEKIITEAKFKSDICVLFYPPYYATELERPLLQETGLQYHASAIRRPAYFDGLLKALQILNIDYDMADLTKTDLNHLSKYKQIWAFSTDEMNETDQQLLIHYVTKGGNLILFPYLPDREMNQKPCSIIRNALGIEPSGMEFTDSPLIDILGFDDIKCANPQSIFDENYFTESEILARTIKGAICGFRKKIGNGTLIHIGTWLGFDTEGHKPVYKELAKLSAASLQHAYSDNDFITVRQRFTQQNSGLLFIGNYYNQEHRGKITYTHPESGEPINIPYAANQMPVPPLYGILTPLCLPVYGNLKILHCTSDIIDIKSDNHEITFLLYGDRDLPGEMVFEGNLINQINHAETDGLNTDFRLYKNRLVLNYRHKHQTEIQIKLKIKKNDS